MHAAENDHVRVGLRRLLRKAERIADEIRHVLNFRHLIIVRENDGVELFLERENFRGQRFEALFAASACEVSTAPRGRVGRWWRP